MKKAFGTVLAVVGLVVLGFGVSEAVSNWAVLWRWWLFGGVSTPGDLALTITLLAVGGGILHAARQVWEGE